MIEVFITNIKIQTDAEKVVEMLKSNFPTLKINFDMDETGLAFPCGHTVIRIEGINFNIKNIISIIKNEKFLCEVMEDRICA
ncbi:hypothetical protein [Kordia sp.]|uniref:hypothetical protein n=1 Tax=Kordia sp. TaxID=1965332 RepID=UPI003B5CBDC4